MREPLFTQVTQIGVVVPDLEAAIRHYEDDYGIGPWQRWELDPERASDVQVNGQPAELWRVKVASAMVGQMHWELTDDGFRAASAHATARARTWLVVSTASPSSTTTAPAANGAPGLTA